MTSKEALEKINDILLRYYEHYDYSDIEVIKQDLERLEKYKNAIKILQGRICVHNQYICYDAYADIRLKDNEIELLREVLENE